MNQKSIYDNMTKSERIVAQFLIELGIFWSYVYKNGKIIEMNKKAEEIFGLTEKELKKKPFDFWKGKLISEKGIPMKTDDFPISVVSKTKKPSEGITVGLRMKPNKKTRWFTHSARPIFDGKGEIEKIITTFVEITKNKEFEEILQEKLEELEKWKRVTVDRELKMTQLKERLREMEKDI